MSVLTPFDHVIIEDVEFVLHHRHVGTAEFNENGPEWRAIDKYGNKVGIREKYMEKLLPFVIRGYTTLQEPIFFKVQGTVWQRIESEHIGKEIAADKVCGSFIGKDGLKYTWDIKNFTIETDLDAYTLQILTRGGWWL